MRNDRYGNTTPFGATHFDTFWKQFLKVDGDTLYVRENHQWNASQHKDGVDMINNGECEEVIKGQPCNQ